MTVKNTKRINQPALSTNKKLSREFMHVIDNKTGMISTKKNVDNLSCGSGIRAWWYCHDNFPGTTNKCNHEWISVIKDRAMKGQGCPSCSGNVVTINNCLAVSQPSLKAEWDCDKNDKSPWEVTKSSSYLANWVCCTCSHEWKARVNDRYNNKGCPVCARKIASSKNNLAYRFLKISAELHPNSEVIAENTLPFSNKMAEWLCPNCSKHWNAIISSRTMNDTGCPHCHSQKSYHEMRILAELRSVFPNLTIKSGVKFSRKEADIFIPSWSLIIENDGTYYHKDIWKDKNKNIFFEKKGLLVLRVRGEGLQKIQKHDVITENRHRITKKDVNHILNAIGSIVGIGQKSLQLIEHYKKNKNFKNDKEYFNLIRNMNLPTFEKSLVSFPEIVKKWGTLNKLQPRQMAFKSNTKVYLKCIDYDTHAEWTRTASDLTRTDSRRVNLNCPTCQKNIALKI